MLKPGLKRIAKVRREKKEEDGSSKEKKEQEGEELVSTKKRWLPRI